MASRLLVLAAGGAYYGVETDAVKEIVPARAPTRVPGAPPFVFGIVNVRGTLVTTIDLARRISDVATDAAERSVVIVQAQGRVLGLLVDDVVEVHDQGDEALLPAGGGADAALRGLGHFDGRVVLVVDVQELARQTLA